MVCTLRGHEGWVEGLAFTADGRRLVTASSDTTLLVWDVAAVTDSVAKASTPTAAAIVAAWRNLADDDAKTAWRAVQVLLAAPEQSTSLLRRELRPTAKTDPNQVERLLADLDSDDFSVRDRATRELERCGEQIEPAVRRFLDSKPFAEARRRAEALLDRFRGGSSSPEQLQRLRALEVLERIGTDEAKQLVQALAEGIAEDRVTQDAAATLRRMARTAPSSAR
jgi:hypothetical protein